MGSGASSTAAGIPETAEAARAAGHSQASIDTFSTAYATAKDLLLRLKSESHPIDLPIKPHSERLGSGKRGLSLAFLLAFEDFVRENGGDPRADMSQICKGESNPVSVCFLTASTGLSLAESLAHLLGGVKESPGLIGEATTFFSYSWTGTSLSNVVASIGHAVANELAAAGVSSV